MSQRKGLTGLVYMSNLEKLLECLVTPFIDPKTAVDEWKRREAKKNWDARSVGEKRCETGAKRSQ